MGLSVGVFFFFVGFGLFLRLLGLRLFGLRDGVNEGLYGESAGRFPVGLSDSSGERNPKL